ncbi:hypothetical protein AQUCO_00500094v1 [Aquilegia coerulea]|uniref:Uncharacterized protein n=1 Tax=Aquilegia coerulea TaxID=218851 RepID=A0A2G5EQB5_AQUCA|nr:hypothetical protein AQUCO_00500094v1 [Aquilegia coerulea]
MHITVMEVILFWRKWTVLVNVSHPVRTSMAICMIVGSLVIRRNGFALSIVLCILLRCCNLSAFIFQITSL